MADKPIIFSAPMVRALLGGRKTQTRRVLKVQAAGHAYRLATYDPNGAAFFARDDNGALQKVRLPYAPGDRLYVREAWSGPYNFRNMKPRDRAKCGTPQALPVWYWADGNPESGDWESPRPSIHMPRWASRLTLTVTDVRVQRLQEISEADVIAEGVGRSKTLLGVDLFQDYRQPAGAWLHSARVSFSTLWNSLHGPEAWAANPWVVALTFTVQRENIDRVEASK